MDVTTDPEAEWWTTSDVAAYLDVRVSTVTAYRRRSQMPEPDRTIGRTPVWRPKRIIEWHESRPRPGAGGRPGSRGHVEDLGRDLREAIASGRRAAGDKLPSERELAAESGAGRTAVRSMLARLAADGLIEAQHGRGYFVSPTAPSGVETVPESTHGAGVDTGESSGDGSNDVEGAGGADAL
ncbi:hypothetical protein KBI5_08930 [Frankia sp. KB5]|nr:hypothetical protein KBI5_08930 [Frankia sp. KB5]